MEEHGAPSPVRCGFYEGQLGGVEPRLNLGQIYVVLGQSPSQLPWCGCTTSQARQLVESVRQSQYRRKCLGTHCVKSRIVAFIIPLIHPWQVRMPSKKVGVTL